MYMGTSASRLSNEGCASSSELENSCVLLVLKQQPWYRDKHVDQEDLVNMSHSLIDLPCFTARVIQAKEGRDVRGKSKSRSGFYPKESISRSAPNRG